MLSFSTKIISNIKEAEDAWKKFSPKIHLHDDWDFRFAFYKFTSFPARFYLGFVGDEPIGLMPLQYNSERDYLEAFGGIFMENNKVFIKPGFEKYISEFYRVLENEKVRWEDILCEGEEDGLLEFDDYTYHIPLNEVENFNDYLNKFWSGKSRQTLRRQLVAVEREGVEIVINNFSDLDYLFQWSIKTFGDESWFCEPFMKETFKALVQSPLKVFLMSLKVKGEIEAVSFSILYKGVYNYVIGGTNKDALPNLGKYLIYKNIMTALDEGVSGFGAGLGDCNWKERWHLQKTPQYTFRSIAN